MATPPVVTDLMAYNFNLETADFLAKLSGATTSGLVGQSFMHELAREGDVLSAELILNAGAEIDRPDDEGRRPLHEAAGHGRAEMVDFLLKNGALIDAPIYPFGHTALFVAVERGQDEVVRLLIARGARLNVQDALSGQGLLHLAAGRGDIKMCGILIAAGIDTFQEDRRGQTARDFAAKGNHKELEAVLLKVMEHHAKAGI